MIIVLAGAKKNIGDYLIGERAIALLKTFVDDDVIVLDRFKNLEEHLETINQAQCVVLCGGPAYANNIYPGIYPLVDDLSKIKVPIIPFGLGWSGKPANQPEDFRFTEDAGVFLKNIHANIKASSCRDVLTEQILLNNGIENATMTGCPVWYDLESIGKEFSTPEEVKKVVITTPASQKLVGQTLKIGAYNQEPISKCKIVFELS